MTSSRVRRLTLAAAAVVTAAAVFYLPAASEDGRDVEPPPPEWTAEPDGRPLLIEWDAVEPSADEIAAALPLMQNRSFDGCVLNVRDDAGRPLCWDVWSAEPIAVADYAGAVGRLRSLRYGRLAHRFLRVNVTPGDVAWDDRDGWKTVTANTSVAARIAAEVGCRGLMFDTEQYVAKLFDPHAGPNGNRDPRLLPDLVRRAGGEWIDAVEAEFPDPVILLTFGFRTARHPPPSWWPPEEYRLLGDFLDGVLRGCSGETQIVDCWEHAYAYRTNAEFTAARDLAYSCAVEVAGRRLVAERFRVGFGLWTDYAKTGVRWDAGDFSSNYHSPEQFGEVVASALSRTDRYVFLYSGEPDWWSPDGVPDEYAAALSDARNPVARMSPGPSPPVTDATPVHERSAAR